MEIIFLGTSAMIPTKERNHSGILINHKNESLLFDCGEGIQRQMKTIKVDINRIKKICISHWHGDHVLGLPGLIQTMAAQNYTDVLQIYGPKGSKKYFENMLNGFAFDSKRMKINVNEVKDGIFYTGDEFSLEAAELDHSILTYGYAFKENDKRKIKLAEVKKLGIPEGPLLGKIQNGESIVFNGKKINADDVSYVVPGKKITYIADTIPCKNAVKLSSNADILICEATHMSGIEDKTEEYKHMTSKQAAQIANEANARKLVLNHFSQRYKTTADLEREAKDIFPNTVAAFDFMKIKL